MERTDIQGPIMIFTPLHITGEGDLAHANYQSELQAYCKARLKTCCTMMTIDKDATHRFDKVFVNRGTDRLVRLPRATGIVVPTQTAVKALQGGIMLRITMDTQITDPDALIALLEDRASADRSFLTGAPAGCNDIFRDLANIGIKQEGATVSYVQGNFMLASHDLWTMCYLNLPRSVTHYRDDSVFSYMARHYGTPPEWVAKPMWRHNRKADAKQLKNSAKLLKFGGG